MPDNPAHGPSYNRGLFFKREREPQRKKNHGLRWLLFLILVFAVLVAIFG